MRRRSKPEPEEDKNSDGESLDPPEDADFAAEHDDTTVSEGPPTAQRENEDDAPP